MQRATGSRFVAELLDLALLRALLWMPSINVVRGCDSGDPQSVGYLHSWSLIGWTGTIYYALLVIWNGRGTFRTEPAMFFAGIQNWMSNDLQYLKRQFHDGHCSVDLTYMNQIHSQEATMGGSDASRIWSR